MATIADETGVEYWGVQDHPYNPCFIDTMTLVTWLLSLTTRVRIFPNVVNLPLRAPTMLAKQCATIDRLSEGRLELGHGAGAAADAIAGMG